MKRLFPVVLAVLAMLLWCMPTLAAPLQAGDVMPAVLSDGSNFSQWIKAKVNRSDWQDGYLLYVWRPDSDLSRRQLVRGFDDVFYPVASVCYYSDIELMTDAVNFYEANGIKTPVAFTQDERFNYGRSPYILFVKQGIIGLAGITPETLPSQPFVPAAIARVIPTVKLSGELTTMAVPWGDTGRAVFVPVNVVIDLQYRSSDSDRESLVSVEVFVITDPDNHRSIAITKMLMRDGDTITLDISAPVGSTSMYLDVEYEFGEVVISNRVDVEEFTSALKDSI